MVFRKRPRTIAEMTDRLVGGIRDAQKQGKEVINVLGLMPLYANDFRHHIEANGFEASMVAQRPQGTGCVVADAWIAGLAEHLSQKYGIEPPQWCNQAQYFLDAPVTFGGPGFQQLALIETPSAWRRRLIFCGASAF